MRLKRSSIWTKLLLLIVVVYAIITLVDLQDRIAVAKAEVATLEQQLHYAKQDQALARRSLFNLGTDASVKNIARARLGMVESGEIVFYDADVQ